MMRETDNAVLYRACSKKTIAAAYNISYKTLRTWLKPIKDNIGNYEGRLYKPNQVEKIVQHFGEPEKVSLVRV